MNINRITRINAYIIETSKESKSNSNWIRGQVASPMSRYPEFRKSRESWGKDILGKIVVEVESNDGTIGFAIGIGDLPAAWIIEKQLSKFVLGKSVDEIDLIWDQMFFSTIHYGRKGLILYAISAVDLALWDLLGKVRNKPVYELIGKEQKEEIKMYATGPNPIKAKQNGFIGAKIPLIHHPSEGREGFQENVSIFKEARESLGEDFLLMYDCWMSLDLEYSLNLAKGIEQYGVNWIEECFIPDDYWSYRSLRQNLPRRIAVATGEHEFTEYGFRILLDMECADILQPDIAWTGGMTQLIRITKLASSFGKVVIPHNPTIYGYHFINSNETTPFAEFIMDPNDGISISPFFKGILEGEPIPTKGSLKLTDLPGFGVRLNQKLKLRRISE